MMTRATDDSAVDDPVVTAPHSRTVRRIASRDLFGAACELVIVHDQSDYRLRITANNKLILTK
ncbi:MAG: hemin uptake protein HemP [Alphaproteobacteria bacterium]